MKPSQIFQVVKDWTLEKEDESVARFSNTLGDTLTINYFGKVPDIGSALDDLAGLRAFYRHATEVHGAAQIASYSICNCSG